MPFEIDSRIPLSFQYGPSAQEQMEGILRLSDLVERNKAARAANAEIERKRREQLRLQGIAEQQATEQLDALHAPSQFEQPLPQPVEHTGDLQMPPAPPEQPSYIPQDLQRGYLPDKGVAPVPIIPQNTPEMAATQNAADQQQYAADEAARKVALANDTPQNRIPPEYSWMQPQEYEHMLRLQQISFPEAENYLTSLADRKYKLAQTTVQDTKAKDLKDFQIGSILNAAWHPNMTPEENDALTTGLINLGYNPVEARSAVDNAKALVEKYQTSPAMQGAAKLAETRKMNEARLEAEKRKEERENRKLALDEEESRGVSAKRALEMAKIRAEINAMNKTESGDKYKVEDLYTDLENLKNHKGFATGMDYFKRGVGMVIKGSPESDFMLLHESILAQLKLASRGELKGQGQVSDMETKMLGQASTKLNLDLSEKAYRQEIDRLERYLQWKVSNGGREMTDSEARSVLGGAAIRGKGNGGGSSGSTLRSNSGHVYDLN